MQNEPDVTSSPSPPVERRALLSEERADCGASSWIYCNTHTPAVSILTAQRRAVQLHKASLPLTNVPVHAVFSVKRCVLVFGKWDPTTNSTAADFVCVSINRCHHENRNTAVHKQIGNS